MGWVSVTDALDSPCCAVAGCTQDAERGNRFCAGHIRFLREVNSDWGRPRVPLPPQSRGGLNGEMATQAEVTELIGHVRKAGYKVTKSGNSKHWKVLSPRGSVVVDDNGPLIISTTPSEHRFREMTVKRLMAAGVLKQDPYKATQSNPEERGDGKGNRREESNRKGAHRLSSPDIQARKVAAIKAKSARLKEQTARLRARFEPIVAKLGGWSPHGSRGAGVTTTELGEVMFAWATNRGREELPKVLVGGGYVEAKNVAAAAQTFKTLGGTLGEKWLPLFEVFVDDLERDTGTPPKPEKAAERYMALLREAKGISPGPQSPAPLPPITERPVPAPPPKVEPEPGARIEGPGGEVRLVPLPTPVVEPVAANGHGEHEKIGPRYDGDTFVKAPQLALDALYEMAAHSHPNDTATRVRHMDLARQIAELELNQGRNG